jgi:hypothetical protein
MRGANRSLPGEEMKRRRFLVTAASSVPSILTASSLAKALSGPRQRRPAELSADVVVCGGGLGGCAAALAGARNGLRVILTEETDWLGGQLTAQAVPPDEHPWIESFGCTQSYRCLRTGIRDYYRRNYPLTAEALERWNLNPGDGSVSKLCHEPRVALAVLYDMIARFLGAGRLLILLRHRAVSADLTGDIVRAVAVRDLSSGAESVLTAPYFIDATELGDLLPLTKTEYVTGFESQQQTGEPHAPAEPMPRNMQAITWCFPMEYVAGANFVIDKPRDYEFWQQYVPKLKPRWPGRLLDLTYTHPVTLEPRRQEFDPAREAAGLWTYRRIADRRNFRDGFYAGSITLVNWPQNDYMLGNVLDEPEPEIAKHLDGAKQLSLALLYWLQTQAPRPDGGTGWPGLRLRPELVDTADGLAKYPYIRESRRIMAEFTVLEQHVGTDARAKIVKKPKDELHAEVFPDSVGVGSYRIDLHPSTGGDNYIDISSLPFQIPLGSLIPLRVENLLAGCKNLGATHITNGCYRLHPVEWNLGESAGAVVAFCVHNRVSPRQVRRDKSKLRDFQRALERQGVELAWPRLRPR